MALPAVGDPGTDTVSPPADWASKMLLEIDKVQFNVRAYGAIGNGTADDTTAIQNTINAVASAGGGVVWFPTGVYKTTATLTVSSSGIILRGPVTAIDHFAGSRLGKGAEIQWAGANGGGPVIDFGAAAGSGTAIKGGGIEHLAVYASNQGSIPSAGVGIRVRSVWNAIFRGVSVKEATTACWQFTSHSTGFTGGDSTIHNCIWYGCSAFSYSFNGIPFHATSTAASGGLTLAKFHNTFAYAKDATACLDLAACDDIFWYGLCCGVGGTANGIELRGKNVGSGWQSSARNIHFYSVFPSPNGDIMARAGDGTDPSHANFIHGLSHEDGVTAITVESGAHLDVEDTRGTKRHLGSHSLHSLDFYGGTWSTTGPIRFPNDVQFRARNAADSADVGMWRLNTLNEFQVDIGARFNSLLNVSTSGLWFAQGAHMNMATTTGTKIGTATNQLIGVYGVTPIAQRAGAAQVAVATTAATNTTPFGYTTQAQADAIVTLVNELRAWAVAQGWIKGAA